jgi:hypothetical protein
MSLDFGERIHRLLGGCRWAVVVRVGLDAGFNVAHDLVL